MKCFEIALGSFPPFQTSYFVGVLSSNLLVDVPEEFDIVEQSSQDEDSHWKEQNQSRGDGGLK